jgi:SprT-like family
VQLGLWEPEVGSAAGRLGGSSSAQRAEPPSRQAGETLIQRLHALGLPPFPRLDTHRNQQVMLSWIPGRRLRVHEGYAHAPDEVLAAIVRYVRPGTRRLQRLEARRIFLAFPAEDHAPAGAPEARPPRPRPEEAAIVAELQRLHAELNRAHFEGRLEEIPIHLSLRMRTRLGELRMQRKTGRPLHIGISRRHLRRDGWRGVRETLLHEMIHQWQAETGRAVDHGSEFRRRARAMGITPRAVRVD